MKYAILGGTFNPIHTAHLIMAEYVFATGLFDKILIMPSGNPPHKAGSNRKKSDAINNNLETNIVIDKKHRLNMCELVANHKDYFEVSTMELDRVGRTYTVDTIERLLEETEHTYSMIIGADSLMNLEKWYQPKRLLSLCDFVVVDRITNTSDEVIKQIQYLEEKYEGQFTRVPMPLVEISSTMIRVSGQR
jgi:nicotinate-nucleotide adenylyltransferase